MPGPEPDTICECGDVFDEHNDAGECQVFMCLCLDFTPADD